MTVYSLDDFAEWTDSERATAQGGEGDVAPSVGLENLEVTFEDWEADYFEGKRTALKEDGGVDRSDTLHAIACAIVRHRPDLDDEQIALVIQTRDHVLGFHKFTDRPARYIEEVRKARQAVADEEAKKAQEAGIEFIDGEVKREWEPFKVSGPPPNRPPPRSWLVPGFAPLGHATMIYGPEKTAKTKLMIALGLCISTGLPWLELEIPEHWRSPFIYFDFEHLGEEEFWRQVFGIAVKMNVPATPEGLSGLFYIEPDCLITDKHCIDRMQEAIDGHGAIAIAIDSSSIAGLLSNEALINLFPRLRTLRQPKTGVQVTPFLIDHQARMGAGETADSKLPFMASFKEKLVRALWQTELRHQEPGLLELTLTNRYLSFGAKDLEPIGVRILIEEDLDGNETTDLKRAPLDSSGALAKARPARDIDFDILRLLEQRPGTLSRELAKQIVGQDSGSVSRRCQELRKAGKVQSVPVEDGDPDWNGKGNRPNRWYLAGYFDTFEG